MDVPAYSSFMRLKARNSVDLPQPEGPMMAVILFAFDVDVYIGHGFEVAVENIKLSSLEDVFIIW